MATYLARETPKFGDTTPFIDIHCFNLFLGFYLPRHILPEHYSFRNAAVLTPHDNNNLYSHAPHSRLSDPTRLG